MSDTKTKLGEIAPPDQRVVPWEPMNQIKPSELPDENPDPERFPTPWGVFGRGNGHMDVLASDSTYVAHVYCWSAEDFELLNFKVAAVNGEEDGSDE